MTFPLFRASFYDFATYRGPTTGQFYRIDVDRIRYADGNIAEILTSLASSFELSVPLQLVPNEVPCAACGAQLALSEAELSTLAPPAEQLCDAVLA